MNNLKNMTMNELEYLRKVLANAVTEESTAIPSAKESQNLMEKLSNLQGRQSKINRLKLVVIFCIILYLITTVSKIGVSSIAMYVGIIVILLSIVVFMTFYLRNQFNTAKLDYSLNSIQFAQQAIGQLKKQKSIFGVPFMLFLLFMIIGANILFLGIGTEHSMYDIILVHLGLSAMIAVFASLGLLVRRSRTKKEVDPIIEELNQIINNVEK